MAAATVSKRRTDSVHNIVYEYGRKWRFSFNAKKSAVLVYGESKREHEANAPHRVFKLGQERVSERVEYDHVGVKSCIYDFNPRVSEKISKARRKLNASAGLGIRKNGLSISVGTIIDYNRRLLGCVFHNDLSIMKLVIDNNCKIRHLAAKHETKKPASCQLSRYETKHQNT